MLDLFLELLGFLAGLFFEAILEFAGAALLDLILRAIAAVFDASKFQNPLLAYLGYVFLGGATGGFSLLLFPHPLFHPSRFHGISLIIGPAITGLAMWLVGAVLRSNQQKITRIESFGYGFAFAFGMALIRFLFTR